MSFSSLIVFSFVVAIFVIDLDLILHSLYMKGSDKEILCDFASKLEMAGSKIFSYPCKSLQARVKTTADENEYMKAHLTFPGDNTVAVWKSINDTFLDFRIQWIVTFHPHIFSKVKNLRVDAGAYFAIDLKFDGKLLLDNNVKTHHISARNLQLLEKTQMHVKLQEHLDLAKIPMGAHEIDITVILVTSKNKNLATKFTGRTKGIFFFLPLRDNPPDPLPVQRSNSGGGLTDYLTLSSLDGIASDFDLPSQNYHDQTDNTDITVGPHYYDHPIDPLYRGSRGLYIDSPAPEQHFLEHIVLVQILVPLVYTAVPGFQLSLRFNGNDFDVTETFLASIQDIDSAERACLRHNIRRLVQVENATLSKAVLPAVDTPMCPWHASVRHTSRRGPNQSKTHYSGGPGSEVSPPGLGQHAPSEAAVSIYNGLSPQAQVILSTVVANGLTPDSLLRLSVPFQLELKGVEIGQHHVQVVATTATPPHLSPGGKQQVDTDAIRITRVKKT